MGNPRKKSNPNLYLSTYFRLVVDPVHLPALILTVPSLTGGVWYDSRVVRFG